MHDVKVVVQNFLKYLVHRDRGFDPVWGLGMAR